MAIRWRFPTENELDVCLDMSPERLGAERIGDAAARAIWRRLFREPSVICALLEADPPLCGQRIVGFGASVFVAPAFLDAELAQPAPFMNMRIIEGVQRGDPVLLSRADIAAANARDGVDVVVMHGTVNEAAHEGVELQTVSAMSFVESHAGYRVRRIAVESSRPWQHDGYRHTGIFDVHAVFDGTERMLHVTTRDKGLAMVGSMARQMFLYREPTLRLREADQALLIAALDGDTDDSLSSRLHISVSAVKARWRSALDRVRETMPDLIGDTTDSEPLAGRRGAQKRHRLLAYVRAHPEELRPFDWSARLRSR